MNGRTAPQPWKPMRRAVPMRTATKEAMIRARLAEIGTDPELTEELLAPPEIWQNDRYTVIVKRDNDDLVVSLSIRRNDRKAIHDWRHLQRIKNDIAGLEVEAVELYPAESRLVDSANQFWLWCFPPGERIGIGFNERVVSDGDAAAWGAVQRPLDAQ